MDIDQLTNLGLTKPLAKAYLALLKFGEMSPPTLAKEINETRTNTYSILDKLVALKLARQIGKKKKLFKAANPTHLEDFVRNQKLEILDRENRVSQILPTLTQMYFKVDSEPGVRFFSGKEEIKKIYQEQIESKESIYLIRSSADFDYYAVDYLSKIRNTPAKYGVNRYGITPDIKETNPTAAQSEASRLERTWVDPKDYDAKVEWGIFGDKVSAISFGEEGVGMIIESPQIAESMRQIFELAKAGTKARYPKPKYGYRK